MNFLRKAIIVVAGVAAILAVFFVGFSFYLGREVASQDVFKVCDGPNLDITEERLEQALGTPPKQIGAAMCYKTAYSSDMIATMQLDPATVLPGLTFTNDLMLEAAPIDELYALYPAAFTKDAISQLAAAQTYDAQSRAYVTFVKLPDRQLFALITDF